MLLHACPVHSARAPLRGHARNGRGRELLHVCQIRAAIAYLHYLSKSNSNVVAERQPAHTLGTHTSSRRPAVHFLPRPPPFSPYNPSFPPR
eukprot:251863-Chlamydomonas_euryale.AAC.1